ncbi:MAG: electron transfer flavoprotein subunit beta/FixA family protein [Chloroflexi bacterium]|nr:electron transfer flavoprotein subunit beta/FixA family protein [Chloroflexota bacterium]
MKILVFMKQVPDTAAPISVKDNQVDASKIDKYAASPYDEYALEQALQIKDKAADTKITLVTLGPARVREMIMQGLAMGADDAVIIKHEPAKHGELVEPNDLDGLAVANVLAAAAKKIGYDLIYTGTKGVDDDQGWVGIAMGELLGLPLVAGARSTEVSGGTARVLRDVEGGKEKLEVSLPALITSSQATEPRYPTLKGIMGAKRKPVLEWDIASLGVAADALASRVERVALDMPPGRQAGRLLLGEPNDQVQELVRLLREQAKVI